MKRKILIIVTTLIGCFFLFIISFLIIEYKSVEIPESECEIIEGIVTGIAEGGVKDVTFTLAGTKNCFYINRGLENQVNLADLEREILGKKVTIFYSNHTNILSGKNSSRHIRKLKIGSSTFYSEF